MKQKSGENRVAMRDSEAFKMTVARESEKGGLVFEEIRRKYGIGKLCDGALMVGPYGNGTRGRRRETPSGY
ncbi:MAG: hypothetical protein ACREE6_04905 [Limisphaerales bacterium]